jgi:DNA (cytosine-5)-methyltransferase 1
LSVASGILWAELKPGAFSFLVFAFSTQRWRKFVSTGSQANKSRFTFIDLFAGIGGMRIGFESAGGRCILTSEIDEPALKTYSLNYSPEHSHKYFGDISSIKSVDVPKHDVLVAGFPCQPYSIAGLRKGLRDERGTVFMEIIRILEDKKPKALLLENVKGILAHDKGETFKYMLSLIERIGYTVKFQTLNSMTHSNVPQNRERVFIAGFLSSNSTGRFTFPGRIPLTKTIKDLIIDERVASKYYYDDRFDCYKEIKKVVKSSNTLYQWRRQYVRENKSDVCPTLTANMGSGGHNVPLIKVRSGIRKLTPRECANFQGFSKRFKLPEISDSELYHQFGNSVTVPLIARIAKNIAKEL